MTSVESTDGMTIPGVAFFIIFTGTLAFIGFSILYLTLVALNGYTVEDRVAIEMILILACICAIYVMGWLMKKVE